MSPVSVLLNLLWLVFGGVWMALAWIVAAVIMAITIIGMPVGARRLQHRLLHAAAVRPQSRVARRISRHG